MRIFVRSVCRKACRVLTVLLALGLVGACAAPAPSGTQTVRKGTVFYRERISLPRDAELRVDAYKSDATGRTLVSRYQSPTAGQSIPLPYHLEYEQEEGTSYVLEAAIAAGGETLFSTKTPVPADEAASILVYRTIKGTTSQEESAAEHWALIELYGKPAQHFADQEDAHLMLGALQAGKGTVSGSDGCNRIAGSYTMQGTRLHFGNLASTMMLCPKGDQQARLFTQALGAADGMKREGNRLQLRNGGEVLAVFEAQ